MADNSRLLQPILSVVIPLYFEGQHLDFTILEIVKELNKLDVEFEIVLVDDGSTDNTWENILLQKNQYYQVRGIRLSRNFGKESAIAAGLMEVRGNAIVVMDGDLQHPPELIPQMFKLWQYGAEVVEAVKQHRGRESTFSRIRAKFFYSLFSWLTGFDLRGASDFKLMDRKVLEAWKKLGERNLFFRGMNTWLGFRRVQIPFDIAERVGGQSGWSFFQLLRLAMIAVTSFSSAPLYLVIITGACFMALAFLIGLQTLYVKIIGQAVDGFTTVILLLLIIGGVGMLSLGLIGIYIARIYEEVKYRPRYLIAEQID